MHELFHALFNFKGYWKHLETKYNPRTARHISEFYSWRLCDKYYVTGLHWSVDYALGKTFIQEMPISDVPFMKRKISPKKK